MAIVDSAYSSLLQGMSQQEDASKREGQLKAQVNMWSDPTYGIRRRGGAATKAVLPVATENGKVVITEYENSAGTFYILWNLTNYTAYVFDSNWVLKDTVVVSYLSTATSVADIGTASVGSTGFILNRKVKPVASNTATGARNPVYDGFLLIRTGAFSRSYAVNVTVNGIGSFDFAYTTDTTAANSTPEAIATQFKTQMDANATFTSNFDSVRDGALIFLTRKVKSPANTNSTTVTSNNGLTYVLTSAAMNIAQVSDLPAKLPVDADQAVLSVGTSSAKTYYAWNSSSASWVETSQYGSNNSVTNMPLPYTVSTTGVLSLLSNTYPLRVAGDGNNNPYHNFVTSDITGIASYQGRLIILSGAYVSASSSLDYTKFMRTTVTSLVSTDGFEISSAKAAGASFKYAVQFNKDLVVFGEKHQAVIPSGNTAITPSTAMIVPTGSANLKLNCNPVNTPRTILVPNSNAEYVRLGEVVPSTLVDSQYTYQEVTDHIPTFLKGSVVAMAESSTNSHVVVLGDTETTKLLSHEYYWDADSRKQMAFSIWEFGLPLSGIHYTRDTLVVLGSTAGKTIIATIEGKAPFSDGGNYYLDFYKPVSVVDRSVTVPAELTTVTDSVLLACSETSLKGEPVGFEVVNTTTLRTARSFANTTAVIGLPFNSLVSPTSPVLKDSKDVPLTDSKMILKRYLISVRKTGEFDVEIKSDLDTTGFAGEPILWRSSELGFNKPQSVATGDVSVPIGIPVEQVRVNISTNSTRELNIKDIQYTLKVEARPQRRRL